MDFYYDIFSVLTLAIFADVFFTAGLRTTPMLVSVVGFILVLHKYNIFNSLNTNMMVVTC